MFNNKCQQKDQCFRVAISDNWSFLWWVGALVCTNHNYQVCRASGLIICPLEYKMLVQNGQNRHFQPKPNILFVHIFWTFFQLNHKTKHVWPFNVKKLTRSAPWQILLVPKHSKKNLFQILLIKMFKNGKNDLGTFKKT